MKKIYFYKNNSLTHDLNEEVYELLISRLHNIDPELSLKDCWEDDLGYYLDDDTVLVSKEEIQLRNDILGMVEEEKN